MNKQTTQQSTATGLPGSHLVSADGLLNSDGLYDFHRLNAKQEDAPDFIYANGGIEMRLVVPALGLCVNFLREIAKAGKNVSGYPPTTLAETVEDFLDSLSEEAQRELEQPHQPKYFEFEKEIR